ncbi:MAG: hypothetical protein KAS72_05655 [Phycisphaerales bacterium]|nr:hypothetical protein [Phycisphaerales bacterium]
MATDSATTSATDASTICDAMHTTPRTGRLWRLLICCLLAGAAINVAVAWSCALWAEQPARLNVTGSHLGPEPGPVWGDREAKLGEPVDYFVEQASSQVGRTYYLVLAFGKTSIITPMPSPSQSIGGRTSFTQAEHRLVIETTGFPMRSMRGERQIYPGGVLLIGAMDPLPILRARYRPEGAMIPLRPIWTGFAVNTLLYAMLFAVPLCVLTTVRQMMRRRAGRCPRCGYHLRGDFHRGCPECGWARSPS